MPQSRLNIHYIQFFSRTKENCLSEQESHQDRDYITRMFTAVLYTDKLGTERS